MEPRTDLRYDCTSASIEAAIAVAAAPAALTSEVMVNHSPAVEVAMVVLRNRAVAGSALGVRARVALSEERMRGGATKCSESEWRPKVLTDSCTGRQRGVSHTARQLGARETRPYSLVRVRVGRIDRARPDQRRELAPHEAPNVGLDPGQDRSEVTGEKFTTVSGTTWSVYLGACGGPLTEERGERR